MTEYFSTEDNATTVRTLRNIRETLRGSLRKKYNKDLHTQEELREIEDDILKTHGLYKENFDFINKVEDIIAGHLNDNSVDDNSNKNEKTVAGIIVESTAPVSKALGYDYLYRMMTELYGKKEAKFLSGEMYDYSIAISDSTKLTLPYCWALDASKMVIQGRPFGQLRSAPPKRVSSYINSLDETIHQMSSHLAGAIAIGSFVFDITYLVLYREKKTLEELKTDEDYRKYIENCIQTFVHSVNHLSRNATESPFTNISIFDDVKIRSFVKDMEHYFGKYVNNVDYEEDYIVETVKEIQNIFLDFFDKGDPMKGGAPYRFPVCFVGEQTLNVNDNVVRFDDFIVEEGWNDISNKDVFTYYNGNKVKINKTFKGQTKELIKLKSSNGIGEELVVSPDHQFPTTNGLVKASNLELGDKIELTTGSNKLKQLSKRTQVKKEHFIIGKIEQVLLEEPIAVYNIEVDNEEHCYTLPSGVNTSNCTVNVSKDEDGKIQDKNFVEDIVNREVFRYNIFVSEGSKSASCCRLLSDSDMLEIAGQSNSFGGSGALSLGSHRVATINFNRIALEADGDKETYMEIFRERVSNSIKILKAHKEMIQMLADKGLQQFISNGWIDMNRMFSTVGVLGLVESAEMVSQISDVDKDEFLEDVLNELNGLCESLGKENGVLVNIEQIPAESMSHRLPKVDKLLFGEEYVPYPLYTNQFIPLWEDYSLWDRMEKDGKFNKLITGGGIVHFNLGERTTPSQNRKIIDHAVTSGCEHFSLNPVYSQCENGHSNFGKLESCPNCGSTEITYMTRVVGFFTPVDDWTFEKRQYDFKQRKYVAV